MNVVKPIAATSNLQIMRALIRKDRRFFRVPLISAVLLGLSCYTLSVTTVRAGGFQGEMLFAVSDVQCLFGISFTIIVASTFAGLSIAAERRDGTADFLAILPVTRVQIVLSKWFVGIAMIGGCILFHMLIMVWTWCVSGWPPAEDVVGGIIIFTGVGVMVLGVGWFCSVFTRSPAISSCIAIALPIALIVLVNSFVHPTQHLNVDTQTAAVVIAVIFCFVALITGTVYYLFRIEP